MTSQESHDFMELLSTEIVLQVLQHLTTLDLCRLEQVCKHWRGNGILNYVW